jgi:hypothetical protein
MLSITKISKNKTKNKLESHKTKEEKRGRTKVCFFVGSLSEREANKTQKRGLKFKDG